MIKYQNKFHYLKCLFKLIRGTKGLFFSEKANIEY